MNLLASLGLKANNSGASTGNHWWSTTTSEGEIISYNPTTAKPIATIYRASAGDYAQIIAHSQQAFLQWRLLPAPKRGEIIRAIGEELRKHKTMLGNLVSLEMG